MEKWKTLQSEYIHQSDFGNIRLDKCELPNGTVIEAYHVNEHPDWVNAVVITKEKEIVIVEQFRYAGNDIFFEIPAGNLEQYETHEEGIVREVLEETGYISVHQPILLGDCKVNPATQTNNMKTFLILDAVKEKEQNLDKIEDIKVHLFDFDTFGRMLWRNSVNTQLFTAYAYYMAKDYLTYRNKNDESENNEVQSYRG
ncbi:hypothetical conserved protein [Oceanobacillus iheyensis HTE831]|uniref:Hypothetical conserved protein n=1 Tax=Oceanobacillus iheyensis (strain DSM 14371 / CIP 107618 / JCM 11309 / KCTC 3954 / HTE831) TaxID=221109 RepID=Q8ES54_OCEIH|nr:NUDIX hydrolase [Oceanobacillus iheyensis]BAC12745.1 hypothetical conserved protein [Oceanobacillus iheyensis HTE831]